MVLEFGILDDILYVSTYSKSIRTLYNVYAVPWGVFNTVGDIMSTVADILSTVGVFSTMGEYHDKCGDILSTVGMLWRI